jgi:hypothetical protein
MALEDNPALRLLSDLNPIESTDGWDGGMMTPDQRYLRQFDSAGDFSYSDGAGHKGTIHVTGGVTAWRFRGYVCRGAVAHPYDSDHPCVDGEALAGVTLRLLGQNQGDPQPVFEKATATDASGFFNFYMIQPWIYDIFTLKVEPPAGLVTADAWSADGSVVDAGTIQWQDAGPWVHKNTFYLDAPTPTPSPTFTATPTATPTPTLTPTQTPTQTPTPLPDDYGVSSIRIVDPTTSLNADINLPTTSSSYQIYVTVENLGSNDGGFTVTVTDPGLPGWSASATVFGGLTPSGTCNEIQVSPNWPDTYTPTTCGNHQLVVTLSADDNAANNTLTKSIEIPDTTGETIIQRDNWSPGGSIGNAGYYLNDIYIIASEFVQLQMVISTTSCWVC